ncbi:Pyrethroid hydrolase [Pandoraea iniqua]|uniref:Pyrethroid hydrolase n=1 Tax=Pandoraea iniqua TaxID=2508288 RepID=A0A5E4XNY2_9BURK|nr:alpha/beta hydrolase [Pandoraea iniqua]VVE04810.1 Pyrethroid hydrolase [Pandoraea iniqua]VVE37828.1 Pyrethroid hydrolase [Pandoraea iniqua]
MKRHSIAALLLSTGLMGLAGVVAPASAAETQPSVVIVHGAFADGSDWAKVVALLQDKGVKVTAVQNPLDSLAGDVAAATRAIDNQPGKVVLVGHSWGGAVITEAGKDAKVASLVYVAAFAPDAGESVATLGETLPKAPGTDHITADASGWLSLPPADVAKYFAQDVPVKQANVMAATQGPIKATAFGEKVSVASWHQKPSWFVISQNDRMIAPDAQRAMAKRIGAKVTEVPSSHVPQQSRPADVAKVILDAVASVK